jgi:hypothetical protein
MTSSSDRETRIRIELEGVTLAAILLDSTAAREFRDLLPLELTLQDYAGEEKISDLPRRLDVSTAPPGAAGAVGDIAYYAPWGNLALFYTAAPYADGLVTLGRIEGDVSALRGRAARPARIVRG